MERHPLCFLPACAEASGGLGRFLTFGRITNDNIIIKIPLYLVEKLL
jgi:hypothetical protein